MKKLTFLIYSIVCLGLETAIAQYNVLYNFSNANLDILANPDGSLTSSVTGDTLFGMTFGGGPDAWGSIFYITADGSVYDTLHNFGFVGDGKFPEGSLTLSGKVLYGMATHGGPYTGGVIFSIHTDGSDYTILYNKFGQNEGWGYWGNEPYGSLVLKNGVLYGMTYDGGKASYGNIFRINTDGTHFDTLHSFGISTDDGKNPQGSLVLSGNVLYGMTNGGGQYGRGVIFSIDTNGSAYDTLHNFGSGKDGEDPFGSLTLSANILYGMTSGGGKFLDGNIFSIHTDGTVYDTLHNFGWGTADGEAPEGDLTLSGNMLFGMTKYGGQYSYGTMFSISINGSTYDTLHNFGSGTDGRYPGCGLIFSNGTLFGMSSSGGSVHIGTIFTDNVCAAFTIISQNSTPDNGTSNGSAEVTVGGGNSPYTYLWEPGGQTTDSITGLSAGTYTCTICNVTGCSNTTTVIVNTTTGINNILSNKVQISICPNPNNGNFILSLFGITDKSTVEIYNILGEKIYTHTLASGKNIIDINSQPNGIYLYRVIENDGTPFGEGKFIIQK